MAECKEWQPDTADRHLKEALRYAQEAVGAAKKGAWAWVRHCCKRGQSEFEQARRRANPPSLEDSIDKWVEERH